MADSACAVCGFSTNDQAEFEKHVQQHEDTLSPKLDLQNLIQTQPPPFMQNLPAMAANLLSTYYDGNQLSQLFNKVTSNPNFLNNNLFNNTTPVSEMDSSLNSLPTLKVNVETPVEQGQEPVKILRNEVPSKKSPKTSTKKEGKSKKVLHSCPHCNFTTVMSQHMKSHLEAHDRHQGQMYLCDVCCMQFSQKANMHRHRMRHSGLKPYECRYCNKRFFRKDQMQEHSMTHIKTGENFDCPVANCETQFRQHSALRSHLDEQHTISTNEQAPCKRCAMTFSNSRRLLLHYQTKHDAGEKSPTGQKRDQSVLNEYSDEDSKNGGQESNEGPSAKRPHLTIEPDTAVPSNSVNETSRSDPIDLSAFSPRFPGTGNPTNLFPAAFNWNALGLPLSVAVSQKMPLAFANAFSPQFLPKTKLPNCENLFQNFANTSLSNSLTTTLGSVNFNKFFEGLRQNSQQQQLWEQQCSQNFETATNSAGDDHSSTHSPTSDSLTSSTVISNEAEEGLKNPASNECSASGEPSALEHSHELRSQGENLDSTASEVGSESKLECVHCGISFDDSTIYIFHKTLHASNENPWKCGLCNKEFSDRFAFTTHIVQDQHSI